MTPPKAPKPGEIWYSTLSELFFRVESVDKVGSNSWSVRLNVQRSIKGTIEERVKDLSAAEFAKFISCYTKSDANGRKIPQEAKKKKV